MADPISEQSIRDLVESLDRLVKTMADAQPAKRADKDADTSVKVAQTVSKSLDGLIRKMGRTAAASTAKQARATRDVGEEGVKKANETVRSAISNTAGKFSKLASNADLLTDAFGVASKAIKDMAKNVYKGNTQMTPYAQSITNALDQISNMALVLGPKGLIIKGIIKAANMIAEPAIKQADAQYAAYKELQKFGAATADGIDDVFRMSQAMNIGQEELQKFTQLVAANSQGLAMFRGTVGQGAKDMANMNQILGEEGITQQLLNMGVSIDEQNESIGAYISLQTRLGLAQTKTVAELAKSAAEYIKEQDKITQITGATRKEQEDAQRRAMAVEAYRAKINELREQGQEAEAERLQTLFKTLGTMPGGKELQAQMASAVSGFITETSKGAFVLSGNFQEIIDDTSLSTGQAIEKLGKSFEQGEQTFRGLAQVGQFNKALGLSYDELNTFIAASKNATKSYDEATKGQQGRTEGESSSTKNMAEFELSIINSRKALEGIAQMAVPPLTGAMSGLGKAIEVTTKGLHDLAGGVTGLNKNLSDSKEYRKAAMEGKAIDPYTGKIYDTKKPPPETGYGTGAASVKEEKMANTFTDWLDSFLSKVGLGGGGAAVSGGGAVGGGAVGGAAVPISIAPGDQLGKVSATWESGGKGSEAIGWDKKGGTSYGKYQIAAKTGTMDQFLKFAEQQGRGDVAAKLRAAGPAETGKAGGAMAQAWQQMAKSGELGDLEHQFIKATHFDPAMAKIKDPELKKQLTENRALQEMMWSTSVQHGAGGAAGILNKVYKPGMSQEELIKATYAERSTKFGGSEPGVRESVIKKRFPQEQASLLAMLKAPGGPMLASADETAKKPEAKPTGFTEAQQKLIDEQKKLAGVPTQKAAPGQDFIAEAKAHEGPVELRGLETLAAPAPIPTATPRMTTATTPGGGGLLDSLQSPIASTVSTLKDSVQAMMGGGSGETPTETGDPAAREMLGQLVSLGREQINGINRLIQNLTA